MFSIPSLSDLLQRARQGFRTYLPGSDAWVWPNNVYASAKVLAGMTFEVFGFASYISKMIFASTAPDIETLRLHGVEFGIPQLPAAPAGGNATFSSSGAITVETGATLQRADGVTFLVTSGGLLTGPGTLEVSVTAASDGAISNSEEGTPLTVLSGLVGTATVAVGPGDIVQGADVEDIESYRQRILFRKRNPPHGGSAADYVIWARHVPGVTRVFLERLWAGSGTVRIFVLMDGIYPNGIATPDAIATVAAYIATVQPASAIVTVAAPAAHPINITIDNLVPDTVPTREAVAMELRATFLRLGRVAGNDTPHSGMPFLATPSTFSLSWIYQAIANAPGVISFDLAAPVADVALPVGQTATLGTLSFI